MDLALLSAWDKDAPGTVEIFSLLTNVEEMETPTNVLSGSSSLDRLLECLK